MLPYLVFKTYGRQFINEYSHTVEVEVVTHSNIVSYYIKWVTTSWTYSKEFTISGEKPRVDFFRAQQPLKLHLLRKLLYKMGHYFLDIQQNKKMINNVEAFKEKMIEILKSLFFSSLKMEKMFK